MDNEKILREALINVFARLVTARETLQEVVIDNNLKVTSLCMQNVGQFESYLTKVIFPCMTPFEREQMGKLIERFKQTGP